MSVKRFYKCVHVENREGGFAVLVDGHVLKTPGKKCLELEKEYYADLVAHEWQAQKDIIRSETMPCTRLLNVATDLTPARRPELIEEFHKYCSTDLLCYRAETPQDLQERQHQYWQPALDWAAKTYGVDLLTTSGIGTILQPAISLENAQKYASRHEDIDLTLLLHFTATYGSAVLALAVMDTHIDARSAFTLSRLDEFFQNERWGEDAEARTHNDRILEELVALEKLLEG